MLCAPSFDGTSKAKGAISRSYIQIEIYSFFLLDDLNLRSIDLEFINFYVVMPCLGFFFLHVVVSLYIVFGDVHYICVV